MIKIIRTYTGINAFETTQELLNRGKVINKFLKTYIDQYPLIDDQKYGVVCHSMIIATLTATGLNPKSSTGMAGFTWCENC
jgi:hypothetical protein